MRHGRAARRVLRFRVRIPPRRSTLFARTARRQGRFRSQVAGTSASRPARSSETGRATTCTTSVTANLRLETGEVERDGGFGDPPFAGRAGLPMVQPPVRNISATPPLSNPRPAVQAPSGYCDALPPPHADSVRALRRANAPCGGSRARCPRHAEPLRSRFDGSGRPAGAAYRGFPLPLRPRRNASTFEILTSSSSKS